MIIAISDKIDSGKDTVAEIIQYLITKEKFPNIKLEEKKFYYTGFTDDIQTSQAEESNFQIKRFADKLKDIVCLLIGCTREQLEDREFKEKPLGKEWLVSKNENGNFTNEILGNV